MKGSMGLVKKAWVSYSYGKAEAVIYCPVYDCFIFRDKCYWRMLVF